MTKQYKSNPVQKQVCFNSMQILPDDYNVKIITIYSAAGHGKGLIDDMSSFGVKHILHPDVVSLD